jgi:hypothetical protein
MNRPAFFVAVLVFAIAGCSLFRKPAGPSLCYEMKHRQAISGNCDSSAVGCVKVTFEYPDVQTQTPMPLRDSVQNYLHGFLFAQFKEDKPFSDLDEMVGQITTEYRNLREEFSEYRANWELARTVAVLADTAGVVSFRCTEFSFLGGAHPNSASLLAVFSAPSGKKLNVSECLEEGTEVRLLEVVDREFRKVRNLSVEASLETAGFWFKDGKFALPSNWGVEPSGLLFYYNDYEIAPHSIGPTEVKVPFGSLKGIISAGGPLGQLAVN